MKTNNIHPIIFSTPMVQAILQKNKRMTRRILHPQPGEEVTDIVKVCDEWVSAYPNRKAIKPSQYKIKPKYNIGDILWVRETWQHTDSLNINREDENSGYIYKADGEPWDDTEGWIWKPSIYMPKEACRLFLKVTNVRVERLQDISDSDAIAEGIMPLSMSAQQLAETGQLYLDYSAPKRFMNEGLTPYWSYNSLWWLIYGAGSWEENPWVWVYEFEKVEYSF